MAEALSRFNSLAADLAATRDRLVHDEGKRSAPEMRLQKARGALKRFCAAG